ncbi:MAG TPA: tetraacyldisaccharide 4'-kinase [Flavobacterium sp.]|jgi:tetraacyldisaccharide 4'-kinase
MVFLRKLLFPFALLYWIVTAVRNFLYDHKILKSYRFDVPVIAVGNLNVGGTGKTPQIEYLVRLLTPKYKVAILSRGYKRKSKGFILADEKATAEILGDEPHQYYLKFRNAYVAVDADRRNGIESLLALKQKPDVILLDDAYQHRKVKAGFYILLTAFDDIYSDDYILPMGNLRESAAGAKRANVIVVTKCPPQLEESEKAKIKQRLNIRDCQHIFFSVIEYDDRLYSATTSISTDSAFGKKKILVAGIAKPEPFFEHLEEEGDLVFEYPDHHAFSAEDIKKITKAAAGGLIITTEKDFVRLRDLISRKQLYYLPIKSKFFDAEKFDKTILNYVGTSTADS